MFDRMFEERQAGADDGAASLNGTPGQGIEGTPGGVGGGHAGHQGRHADHACHADEEAEREHQHHPDLARPIKLQSGQERHRHQEDDKVGGDVKSSPPPPEPRVVDTFGVEGLDPISLYGDTLKDRGEHKCQNAANDHSSHHMT